MPDIDLFASRINTKCERYASWKKDPGSEKIDAFTIKWNAFFFYAFPPFSIILKCLQKIKKDQARGIMVVPEWPSQPWYPMYISMLEKEIIKFKPNTNLITLSDREPHPLWTRITLVAGVLSGNL